MSIPVYKAETFEREMVGGRNKPWLLTVKTDRGPVLYVAKFFTQTDIDQQNALSREIYTSVLAGEFDLITPDFALITIDENFLDTLNDEQVKELDHKHTRFAFGSKFIPSEQTFSPSLHTSNLKEYAIELIFAFDVLVLNADRTKKKPNILLGNDEYYLIDHEHTLSMTENVDPRQRISTYDLKKHIFYNVLNNRARFGNKPKFGTFEKIFHRANIDVLESYAQSLQSKGYDTDDSLVIKRYLQELKRDISYFMNIVKGGIQ